MKQQTVIKSLNSIEERVVKYIEEQFDDGVHIVKECLDKVDELDCFLDDRCSNVDAFKSWEIKDQIIRDFFDTDEEFTYIVSSLERLIEDLEVSHQHCDDDESDYWMELTDKVTGAYEELYMYNNDVELESLEQIENALIGVKNKLQEVINELQ